MYLITLKDETHPWDQFDKGFFYFCTYTTSMEINVENNLLKCNKFKKMLIVHEMLFDKIYNYMWIIYYQNYSSDTV